MRLSTRSRVLGLLGAVALAATACGGGHGLGPTGAAGTQAPAPSGASGGGAGAVGTGGADGGRHDLDASSVEARDGGATLPDGKCFTNAYKSAAGGCVCAPGTPSACGGACADLTQDPDNCGACGHACAATSACSAGQCGPVVTNLVPAASGCGSIELALADGTLYWTESARGTVKSLPLGASAGATPTTISSNEKGPWLIEVRGANVFWIDVVSTTALDGGTGLPLTTATLRRAGVSGGAPVDLATEANLRGGIRGLALAPDGQTVYYSAETKVKGVSVGGGAAVEVGHEGQGGIPTALGIDGETIGYVSDLNGNVDAITVKAGASATCGGPPNSSGSPLLIDCVRVAGCTPDALFDRFIVRGATGYWADGYIVSSGAVTGGPVNIKRVIAQTLFSGRATGIAAGADALYFAEDRDSQYAPRPMGAIEKTAYAPDSTAVPIARGQAGPHALVVDATNVYWATSDCAINMTTR